MGLGRPRILYFKEIQILSDMKVRRTESAARWVVVGRIGEGLRGNTGRDRGTTHRGKEADTAELRSQSDKCIPIEPRRPVQSDIP